MVGSAAIKQGRSANRKHTYFFFGLADMNVDYYHLRTYIIFIGQDGGSLRI